MHKSLLHCYVIGVSNSTIVTGVRKAVCFAVFLQCNFDLWLEAHLNWMGRSVVMITAPSTYVNECVIALQNEFLHLNSTKTSSVPSRAHNSENIELHIQMHENRAHMKGRARKRSILRKQAHCNRARANHVRTFFYSKHYTHVPCGIYP